MTIGQHGFNEFRVIAVLRARHVVWRAGTVNKRAEELLFTISVTA